MASPSRLILLLLCLLCIQQVQSLTLQVEPKTTECFFEIFEAGSDVSFSYRVVRGGLLDILVQV